jgi:hypothetical protein
VRATANTTGRSQTSKEIIMTNYVLAYTGGSMAATEQEQAAAMAAWGAWFASLGDAVVDGGNPFGSSATVSSDGSVNDGGASRLGGYSIIKAGSLAAAGTLVKGCPVLATGGAVEVYEALPM